MTDQPGSTPALFTPTPDAGKSFVESFTAKIRNPNPHRANARAAVDFARWREQAELRDLADIGPVCVAVGIEGLNWLSGRSTRC
jgi:hypothetical protein